MVSFHWGYDDILHCRVLEKMQNRYDIEKYDCRKFIFYVFYATLHAFIDEDDNMWQDETIKSNYKKWDMFCTLKHTYWEDYG